MHNLNVTLSNGEKITVEKGTVLQKIVKENNLQKDVPIVLSKVNGKLCELTTALEEEGTFEAVDIKSSIGFRTYVRTLRFILVKAVLDLYPNATVTIEHSLNQGIFGEIHKDKPLTPEDLIDVKKKMKEIIEKDIPIKKTSVPKEEAIKIFESYKMKDKIRLLKYVQTENVKLYELDGRYDYYYGSMGYSTGIVGVFDLLYYEPGFLLRYPVAKDPHTIPPFVDQKKLAKIFYESEQWGNILGVGDVGSLNDKVQEGEITTIIRVAEALQEKKIAYIADMISERKGVRVVLIAGPSSSGKTTFAKRLGIQLRVNGIIPVPVSLDDYFVNRINTPKDEFGEFDFESIYALDLDLFNSHLSGLLDGETVQLPRYNFRTGEREWTEEKLSLPQNGVLIVEGIHGLNEMLTSSVDKQNKFKIYISALTQLNLDNHNRISTTDLRITRRVVRDFLSRGYGGEDTLKMWPSIKRGEEKNIFVYQEEADVMFNSALIYEMCVLKKYALEELAKIPADSPIYYEAARIKSLLNFFKDVDANLVPDTSILREFVGGSYFYKY